MTDLEVPTPELMIPFRIDQEQAVAWYRGSAITEMRGVYVPHWIVSIDCHAYWTADSDAVPTGARAGWAPHFGEHTARYVTRMVPASGLLSSHTLEKLGGWDLSQAVPYTPEAFRDHPAEAFAVPHPQEHRNAVQGIESRLREDCAKKVPGSRQRNLKINPLVTGTHATPALMPVWILACEHRGRTYKLLVNGQSGKTEGDAPYSLWKLLAAVGLAVLLILLLALITDD